MDKTHRISFKWYKIPYYVDEKAGFIKKLLPANLKFIQNKVFNSLTNTMFNAHGNKILPEDKGKDEFEIYIDGSKEQCEKMEAEFKNLHKMDLSDAIKKVPFMYRKKVASKSGTKFEKIQDQLSMLLIYLEVEVNEL
jgi:hypothetical protein